MTDAAGSDAGAWNLGINTALGLAQSGVFGGKIRDALNPRQPLAAPAAAPPPPPVAGQQAVNPPPMQDGIAGHFARNWGKYAIGAGVLTVLAIILLRRRK